MRIVFLQTAGRDAYDKWSPHGKYIVVRVAGEHVAFFGQFGAHQGEVSYLDTHRDVAHLAAEEGQLSPYTCEDDIKGGGAYRLDGQTVTLGGRSASFGRVKPELFTELTAALTECGYEIKGPQYAEDWELV